MIKLQKIKIQKRVINMANPIKTFLEAILGKNHYDEKEIRQAERLGEIVSNNAEISVGIRSKVHIDADKAREAATAKAKKKTAGEKIEEK